MQVLPTWNQVDREPPICYTLVMTTHDKKHRTENQVDAIAYIRVSTCRQVSSGLGLEAQREQLEQWAAANNRTITAYNDLGVSGRNGKRVGLENAVAHACRLKCPLVVANLSRLARSTTDALKTTERLNRAGADLVLLKENIDSRSPCGKFMLTMLAAVASFEAELVGERTREANAVKRSRKEKLGGSIPQGYEAIPKLNDSGEPVLNDRGSPVLVLVRSKELEYVVLEIATLKSLGMTWQEIVDAFNERGVKTPNNKTWSISIVRRILSHSKRAA